MEDFIFNEREKRLEPKSNQCAFCKQDTVSDMDDCHYMPIFKEINRTNIVIYRSIEYSQIDIGVPRCNSCMKNHESTDLKATFHIAILVVLIFSICYFLQSDDVILILGLILGSVTILLGRFFLKEFYLTKTNFSIGLVEAKKSNTIKDFLLLGWSLKQPLN
jgi:uncharacterized protein (UPF0212 family)